MVVWSTNGTVAVKLYGWQLYTLLACRLRGFVMISVPRHSALTRKLSISSLSTVSSHSEPCEHVHPKPVTRIRHFAFTAGLLKQHEATSACSSDSASCFHSSAVPARPGRVLHSELLQGFGLGLDPNPPESGAPTHETLCVSLELSTKLL